MRPPYSPISEVGFQALTELNGSTKLYVDVNRVDDYTPNGSSSFPYKTVTDAIGAIVGSGPANPYELYLAPGLYNEPPLTIPLFTRLVGSGWTATILTATEVGEHFITLSPGCVLREVNLMGPTLAGKAAIHCGTSDARAISIVETTISRGYYGVLIDPTVSFTPVLINNLSFSYSGSNINTLVRATGFASVFVVDSIASGPIDSIGYGFSVDGADAILTLSSIYHACENGCGARVDDDAVLRIVSSVFSNGTTAIQVGSTGSSQLDAQSVQIHRIIGGGYTNDLLVESATASITLLGLLSRDRVSNAVGALLDASYVNRDPSEYGFTVIGELNIGEDGGPVFPLLSYNQDVSYTGIVSGGEVTRDGGLVLNVASGEGYINDGILPQKIEWGASSVTLGASKPSEYVFVNSSGVVSHSEVEPSYINNIVLSMAVTDATDVILLTRDDVGVSHCLSRLASLFERAIGPLMSSGLTVTANVAPLKLNLSSGVFWVGLRECTISGGSAITFTHWYRDGSGGWTKVTGVDTIDVLHWDDSSGALALLNAGKYTNATLYVALSDDGEEYHVVYGQEEFASQLAAETGGLPAPPDVLKEYCCRCAAIVVVQAAAAIASIVDVRPQIGQFAAVTGGVAGDHNLLANLNNDTHLQYLTTGRADTWHGLLSGAHVTNGDTHDHSGGDGAQIDHTTLANKGVNTHIQIDTHLSDGSIHTELTAVAPSDVTKAAAVVGVAATASRSDHKHDVSTGVPVIVGTSNAEGTATSLARSDHVHEGPIFGRDYQTVSQVSRATITGTTDFQNRATLVTPALTGTYRIGWTAVVDQSAINQYVEARLYDATDGAIVGVVQIFRPNNSDERIHVGGFSDILLKGLSYTFYVQYRTTSAGSTAGIADAHIEIWRIS